MAEDRTLYQIALSVSNLAKAVDFYRDTLGLRLIKEFSVGAHLAFFDLGGPRLMIEESANSNPGLFYLFVENLDESVQQLKTKGVNLEQDPMTIFQDQEGLFGPAGQSEVLTFIQDPSGNMIGLMSRK
ncbi:MAG: VOC family protein [Gammaproteobacteria bacterium]|nr:VOC family protein [Gammaproteobacteria bacterium]